MNKHVEQYLSQIELCYLNMTKDGHKRKAISFALASIRMYYERLSSFWHLCK